MFMIKKLFKFNILKYYNNDGYSNLLINKSNDNDNILNCEKSFYIPLNIVLDKNKYIKNIICIYVNYNDYILYQTKIKNNKDKTFIEKFEVMQELIKKNPEKIILYDKKKHLDLYILNYLNSK